MPSYIGTSDFEHGTTERLGVLLVNLGTPDAPTPGAVRRFLADFLWDPRVIEAPRWLWWFLLHGVILRIRPRRSAHAYQQIWTERGSPLLLHSRALASEVQRALSGRLRSDAAGRTRVALGMAYGNPSIATALDELRNAAVRRLIVLPLYPQYSGSTTGSVFDRVTRTLQRWRWLPDLRFITAYCDEPAYIEAVASGIERHWRLHGREHLLFSFHGIPRRYMLAGDPYHCHCLKTAGLVAARLRLGESDWSVSFQSQVGREEWLRPYTDEWLIRFARQASAGVTVVCPGFATDCLETLEEIEIRNRAAFIQNGGQRYTYVPALNVSEAHACALADLITRHIQGWPEADDHALPAALRAEQSRERALNAGAGD